MAQKRKVDTFAAPPDPEEDEVEVPEKYQDRGWKHWLRTSYARYWYVIGCIFADVMVPLELNRMLTGLARAVIPAFVLCALVALQVVVYLRLWPRYTDDE